MRRICLPAQFLGLLLVSLNRGASHWLRGGAGSSRGGGGGPPREVHVVHRSPAAERYCRGETARASRRRHLQVADCALSLTDAFAPLIFTSYAVAFLNLFQAFFQLTKTVGSLSAVSLGLFVQAYYSLSVFYAATAACDRLITQVIHRGRFEFVINR